MFFFLLPVHYVGGWTIPMGVLSDLLTDWVGELMPTLVLLIVIVSAVLSSWLSFFRRPPEDGYEGLLRVFYVGRNWLLLRLMGLATAVMIYFRLGPEFVWADATGHVVLYEPVSYTHLRAHET